METQMLVDLHEVRREIEDLLKQLTDKDDILKVQELGAKLEMIEMLKRTINYFSNTPIIENSMLSETCKLLEIEQLNAETLTKKMQEILGELNEIKENQKIDFFQFLENFNSGWETISDEELIPCAKNILENANILKNGKDVINQEKVDLLAKAGQEGKIAEALENMGIDLSEYDQEARQRILDKIYGLVAAVTTLEEFSTAPQYPVSAEAEEDPDRSLCTRVINLLTPEEKSRLLKIIEGELEKDKPVEQNVREMLMGSINHERIQQIININNDSIIRKIAGMSYMMNMNLEPVVFETLPHFEIVPYYYLEPEQSLTDIDFNDLATDILKRVGAMVDGRTVNDQRIVDHLANTGATGKMAEALENMGIDLSEYDQETRQRIQDKIYGLVFPIATPNIGEIIPLAPKNTSKEQQRINREALTRIWKLLKSEERSELIKHMQDANIKTFTQNFLNSVEKSYEIQDILNENENFCKTIVPMIAAGCYMFQQLEWEGIAKKLVADMNPEDRMIVAQEGKDIQCSGIEDEEKRDFIIKEAKKLCEKEMRNLNIDDFCNTLLKLLSDNQKLQLARKDATIEEFVNTESNPYYKYMFDKLGASEIQYTISLICWNNREEFYEKSPIEKFLAEPNQKKLRKLGKNLLRGAKNIGKVLITSIFSKKEINHETDETPTATSGKQTFFQKLKAACQPEPRISVNENSPLIDFLKQEKKDLNTWWDKLRSTENKDELYEEEPDENEL